MLHDPDWRRLLLKPVTLPLAELLLTELQIVELNEGSARHLRAAPDAPDRRARRRNGQRGAGRARVRSRLGLHRDRDTQPRPGDGAPARCTTRPACVGRHRGGHRPPRGAFDAELKSLRWRMRSRLGERVRWYDQSDDIDVDR
jgi:hypothetical protein